VELALPLDHQKRVYESIFDLLPDENNPTPLVRLRRLVPSATYALYAKLEWVNPFGSVKDRAAWSMLHDLEEKGRLTEQRGMVEPSSGNTGLSLAAMARARGYRARVVVPDKVPLEKKVLLKIVGAELDVLNDSVCPAPGMGEGSINLARSHARAQPDKYVMPNQYENEQNALAHYRTTGPEIWKQTEGRITHLFVSLGTCGTVTGTARFLKEKRSDIRIIAVQPTEGHDIPGLRNLSQLDASKLFDRTLIDEILEIDYELAYRRVLDLAQSEGLLAGPSSALIFEGARRIIEKQPEGLGVMIFPDNIFKYVSHMLKHLPELAQGTAAGM
jgi:cysteine synthase